MFVVFGIRFLIVTRINCWNLIVSDSIVIVQRRITFQITNPVDYNVVKKLLTSVLS